MKLLRKPGSYLVLSLQVQYDPDVRGSLKAYCCLICSEAMKALYIRAQADRVFYSSYTCVALFTLLPATPLQREPVPTGKVVGVILWEAGYMHGIRPGSSKPFSFPLAAS